MANKGCCDKCANRTGICCCMTANEFKSTDLAEIVQNNDRQCTDMPCLLVLIFVIITQIFLIFYPTTQGSNPKLLVNGYDYNGTICDDSNSDGHLTAWPWIEENTQIRICINNCDDTMVVLPGKMIKTYKSYEFIGAYCIPDDSNENVTDSDLNQFNEARAAYQRAIGDLDKSKWGILMSAITGIIIAFIYLRAIACVGRLLIYLTLIIVAIGGFFISWLILREGINNLKDEETKDTGKFEIFIGIFVIIFNIILILALYFMRRGIVVSIEMLNEASRAIRELKQTLVFPCIYAFVGMGYIVIFIIIALFMYSCKDTERYPMPQSFIDNGYTTLEYIKYEFSQSMQNALIYHFICLYFILHVIIYFGFMVLSGTIADWYFSDWNDKQTGKVRGTGTAQLSRAPIMESFFRILRFHLGSLAFGALLITIIRIFRGILKYLEKKTIASSNKCAKFIFCCVGCCLRCCECILNKIAKEGFIFCSIYGTAFCYSSFHAMSILLKNIGKAMIIEAVSKYTEIFGRIAIALLNTGIFVVIMTYLPYYADNLSSVMFPSIIIFILSIIIASHFMQVFEVGVDTIFLCYLIDESVHGKPRFASKKLQLIGQSLNDKKVINESSDKESKKASLLQSQNE